MVAPMVQAQDYVEIPRDTLMPSQEDHIKASDLLVFHCPFFHLTAFFELGLLRRSLSRINTVMPFSRGFTRLDNPRNLYNWGQKLKGLEHILSGYLDEEYMHEKRVLEKEIREVSKEYPSDRYISDGYDMLFSWLGMLARQYQRLGLLIPEDLTYTEGGDEGI